jgi:hypothetical protein
MPIGIARASLRAGRKFEATPKIARLIGHEAIQVKWLRPKAGLGQQGADCRS